MSVTMRFGPYGGRYVPETVIGALDELTEAYERYRDDPDFRSELGVLLGHYVGRPTPMYRASRLEDAWGIPGGLWFKREDLCHTGAHKINNALGQGLLARRMGKKRIIAETGAGQHGVATATVCALFGLECVVYMGEEDMRRQRLNVFRMLLLGATVVGVKNGTRTLKDAISEAMRDWVTNVQGTHYLLGSALGAHPYPMMVRDFHKCIGQEARADILQMEGRLPDTVIACVGTSVTLPPPLVRAFCAMVTGWRSTTRVVSWRYSATGGGASLYLPRRGSGSLKAQCLMSPWPPCMTTQRTPASQVAR